jgi:hypothetical protein
VWNRPIPFHVELGSRLELATTLVGSCSVIVEGHRDFKESGSACDELE